MSMPVAKVATRRQNMRGDDPAGEVRAHRSHVPSVEARVRYGDDLAGAEEPLALPSRRIDVHDPTGDVVQQAWAPDRLDPANGRKAGNLQQLSCGRARARTAQRTQVALQRILRARPGDDSEWSKRRVAARERSQKRRR